MANRTMLPGLASQSTNLSVHSRLLLREKIDKTIDFMKTNQIGAQFLETPMFNAGEERSMYADAF